MTAKHQIVISISSKNTFAIDGVSTTNNHPPKIPIPNPFTNKNSAIVGGKHHQWRSLFFIIYWLVQPLLMLSIVFIYFLAL